MSRQTVLGLMPDICAWLDANNIPHQDVPVDEVPRIADGRITVRVQKRNAKGRKYLDAVLDQVASEVVTVPLLVEPPDVLKPWLAGQVPYSTPSEQRRIKAKLAAFGRESTDG